MMKWLLVLAVGLASQASGAVKTESIDYQVGDVKCKGVLAYDDQQTGKRPGILVAPNGGALLHTPVIAPSSLPSLDMSRLQLDPYGDGKTTDEPKQAGAWAGGLKKDLKTLRARATAAMDVLKKQPQVDPDKIAAIGYCFGGTTVLELARTGAPLLGVVSFHGGLGTPNPSDASNIKGKVLICHGGDDTFESPEEIATFQRSMRDAKVDWQMNVYGGAVHAFTNPDADKHHIPGIAYNAEADRRSWSAMKSFFGEIFGESAAK